MAGRLRFIEVIHSKNYSDSISIGITFPLPDGVQRSRKRKHAEWGSHLSIDYEFKSTRRTQDVFLDSLSFETGDSRLDLAATKSRSGYDVTYNGSSLSLIAPVSASLTPTILPGELKGEVELDAYLMSYQCGHWAAAELSKVLYLGPFRQSPLRRYPTRGSSPKEVGAEGENTITLLANEHVQSKKRPHIAEVSKWLEDLSLAKRVDVSRLGASDLFDVQVQLSDGAHLPIADLGYGMSQVLPVLTQCSFAEPGSTLLFEQPELHLHTSSAQKMAGVLVSASKAKSVSIIAETHSRELVIGVLDEIRQGRLSVDDLAIYTVTREGGRSVFNRLNVEVDEDGRPECYDPWQNIL